MKKTILLMILLIIPLVSAEKYTLYISYHPTGIIDEEGFMQLKPKIHPIEIYGKGTEEIYEKCIDLFYYIDFDYYKDLKLIRVWDIPREDRIYDGLWFLSGIIHIYDGCRNPNTLIHELAHLDNQRIKHDGFFWLSYYRIRGEAK